MKLKTIIEEDFSHYRFCSMVLAFPTCDWKCGKANCQNAALALEPTIDYPVRYIINRYKENLIVKAIVAAGLEPMDSFEDLYNIIKEFRKDGIKDSFVIYTGYNKEEIQAEIKLLSDLPNIIIKFGRFNAAHERHWDPILGMELQGDWQYAEKIS